MVGGGSAAGRCGLHAEKAPSEGGRRILRGRGEEVGWGRDVNGDDIGWIGVGVG